MIRSMTGFGRSSGSFSPRHTMEVAIKTVNHRNLEVSVRLPEFLWEMEPVVRALAAEAISRGKVDISIRVQRTTEPEYRVSVNSRLASAVIPMLKSLAEQQGLATTFSGSDLMRIPDLISIDALDAELTGSDTESFKELVRQALERVASMRATEGLALRADIAARIAAIATHRESLAGMREALIAESLDLFRQRVEEISRAAGVQVAEDRLAQEVVLMVEKGDIAEELTRMAVHLEQIRKLIDAPEPAGKKLDFLSQELLREINTAGQKSRSSAIRSVVIELKTEVERIREQVQNVE